jgi:hypothetical protein
MSTDPNEAALVQAIINRHSRCAVLDDITQTAPAGGQNRSSTMKTEGSTQKRHHWSGIITDKAVVAEMLEQDLEATESRLDIVEAELESVRAALKKERIDGESERQRVSAIKVRAEAKVDRLEHLVEAIAARCRLVDRDGGSWMAMALALGDFKERIADLIEAHRAG